MSGASPFQHLHVAVIGYGSIGRRHCDNLAALGVRRRVVLRRERGANPAFEPPADVQVCHGLADLPGDNLDLAIICNPTSLHAAAAIECLNAGIPVLVEKPLAESISAAQAIIEAAEKTTTLAAVAYPLRHHPAYQRARQIIAEGAIGSVRSATAWFKSYLPDWHPWEDYRIGYAARPELGGGVLPTLDHEIDFLNWCLGKPQQASGTSTHSGLLEGDFHDTAELSVQYAGDVRAKIALSLSSQDRQRGFEFVGTDGALSFDWNRQQLMGTGPSGQPRLLWEMSDYPVNQMYLELLREMLQAVIGKAGAMPAPLASGYESLWVMQHVRPTA